MKIGPRDIPLVLTFFLT